MFGKDYFLETYYWGEFNSKSNEFLKARQCFQIAAEHPELREISIQRLVEIELRKGNYQQARIILKENEDLNSVRLKYLYALLEEKEYNFETSKKYLQECFEIPDMQYIALLKIARLYTQTGEINIAKKIYESLIYDSPLKEETIIDLVGLKMLEGNYSAAYKLLKTISKKNEVLQMKYANMRAFLEYQLGISKKASRNYCSQKLINNSDELILNHLRRHVENKNNKKANRFFEEIDLENILAETRLKINSMNPYYKIDNSIYYVKMDRTIGYMYDELTSDVEVVTRLGTKDIITMYPVKLSDEFDKEELSLSQSLARRRKMGGIKQC